MVLMMKVYYDYQVLCSQVYGGISRYFFEIISRLMMQESIEIDMKCAFSKNKYFEKILRKKALPDYHWRIGELIKTYNKIITKKSFLQGYDIIHPTDSDPYVFDMKKKSQRVVVTIHDMTQERFSESFYRNDSIIHQKKRQIYESDHIIAISKNTKKDILDIYPDIPEDKITVVYHGNTLLGEEFPEEDFVRHVPGRFVLFVGNRYLYKNFDGFVRSMKPILDIDRELYVICAGGGAFRSEERSMISDNYKRYIQMSVNDNELAYLYRKALCFVFPSMYEGFGLPILEAFNCCCPVVLSNVSSMPEVGDQAAVYFNPYDSDDITDKILKVINSGCLREEMRSKGKERASYFDWNTSAKKTFDCYKAVVSDR